MPSSLYVHIPFCAKKCDYCDFLSFGLNTPDNYYLKKEYMQLLCQEIINLTHDKEYVKNKDKPIKLKTIFIGGGTPSLLDLDEIRMLGNCINRSFDLSDVEEFSIEVNPESVELEKIKEWIKIGVNRVSMGVQSSSDSELKTLGRVHSWKLAQKSYSILRQAGIRNINVDMMFSLPNQTMEHWQSTVENIINLDPEHISAYSLMVEEGTKFFDMYKKGIIDIADEDNDRKMYHYLINKLKQAGYYQYEISNFAKPNKECKHNLVYWSASEYFGVGLGASAYINGVRISNCIEFSEYKSQVKIGKAPINTFEIITNEEAQFEEIMLGLRLNNGVNVQKFKEKFGFVPHDKWADIIDKWNNSGELFYDYENGHKYLRLSCYGRDIANSVIADFI